MMKTMLISIVIAFMWCQPSCCMDIVAVDSLEISRKSISNEQIKQWIGCTKCVLLFGKTNDDSEASNLFDSFVSMFLTFKDKLIIDSEYQISEKPSVEWMWIVLDNVEYKRLPPNEHNKIIELLEPWSSLCKEFASRKLTDLSRKPSSEVEIAAAKSLCDYLGRREVSVTEVRYTGDACIKVTDGSVSQKIAQLKIDSEESFSSMLHEALKKGASCSELFMQLLMCLPDGTCIKKGDNNTCHKDYIELEFDKGGSLYTLFEFPDAVVDESGRYLYSSDRFATIREIYHLYHEMGHYNNRRFRVLCNVFIDNDSTMSVASLLSGDGVHAEVDASLEKAIMQARDESKEGDNRWFNITRNDDIVVLEGILQWFAKQSSSPVGIARLLFDTKEEANQILGIRLCNNILYIRKFCDLTFFAEQGFPIRTDHSAKFNQTQNLSFSDALYFCPYQFVNFQNLKLNREFASLLLAVHGYDINEYEKKLAQLR